MARVRRFLGITLLGLLLPSVGASPPCPEPVGGAYFLCAMFQMVKILSLATGQIEGVVVGAIGGGLSCGFGW